MCDDYEDLDDEFEEEEEMHIFHYFNSLGDQEVDGMEVISGESISVRSDMFREVQALEGGSAIFTHLSPIPRKVAHTPEEVQEIISTQRELWEEGRDFEYVNYRGSE